MADVINTTENNTNIFDFDEDTLKKYLEEIESIDWENIELPEDEEEIERLKMLEEEGDFFSNEELFSMLHGEDF